MRVIGIGSFFTALGALLGSLLHPAGPPWKEQEELVTSGCALMWPHFGCGDGPPDAPTCDAKGCIHKHEWGGAEDPALHSVVGLLGTAVMLPLLFALSQMKKTRKFMWHSMDSFMAIFLAVTWFSALGELIPSEDIYLYVAYILSLYGAGCYMLWFFRQNEKLLLTCSGVLSHYFAFALVRLMDVIQHEFFSFSPVAGVLCGVFLLFVMLLVGFLEIRIESSLAQQLGDEELEAWSEAVGEVRQDAGGLALAYIGTQAVHHLAFGYLGSLEEGYQSEDEALFFFGVACFLLVVGTIVEAPTKTMDATVGKLVTQSFKLMQCSIVMACAMGFLVALKWLFFGILFPDYSELFRDVLLAFATTYGSMLLILILCFWVQGDMLARSLAKRALKAVAWLVAWTWEEGLDAALKELPLVTARGRTLFAAALALLLLPVYCLYIKPKVLSLSKDEE